MSIRVTWLADGIFTVIMTDDDLGILRILTKQRRECFTSTTLKRIIEGGCNLLYDVYCGDMGEENARCRVSEEAADINKG